MRILGRLKHALKEGQTAVAAAKPTAEERAGLLLLGARPADISPTVLAKCSVLITDSTDVTDFLRPGINTEYLFSATNLASHLDYPSLMPYLVRRLAIMRVKWRLSRMYLGGGEARQIAEAWGRDPEGPPERFFKTVNVSRSA